MAKTEEKAWYQSKTKWGALLLGGSAVLGTIGAFLSGQIEVTSLITALMSEIGVICGIFGIRDWKIINGIKAK